MSRMVAHAAVLCIVAASLSEAPASGGEPAATAGLSELNLPGLEQLQAPRWGRNPFALPTKEEAMAGTLVLTAILYNPDSKLAIVNGQMVGVGDEIDGRQVVAIGPDHIVVREGKSTKRLDVAQFTTEKPAH
ncbi:MAG: hypothetical protein AB1515_09085 [Nitrospirota bacterium]